MLKTHRLLIRPLKKKDSKTLFSFYQKNCAFLEPWETLPDSFGSLKKRTGENLKAQKKREALYLLLFHGDVLIGMCNFTSMILGAFQACFLGYKIDQDFERKGLMKEALAAAIPYVLKTYRLHRIMASYIPGNVPSAKLLASLGFHKEGIAKDYLLINGKWEDHILTSYIKDA